MMTNELLFEANKERLLDVIKRSQSTKYYRDIINNLNVDLLSNFTYENFKKIPIISKETYKQYAFSMVGDRFSLNKDYYDSLGNDITKKREYLYEKGFLLKATSGSTGKPLEVIKSLKENTNDYMHLNRIRKKITNYTFGGKFLWIWPANPITRKILYSNDEVSTIIPINKYGYQYMLYEHDDNNFKSICEFIIKNEIEWITTSPSVLYSLSNYVFRKNIELKKLKYLECQSEFLFDWQRNRIEEVFNITPTNIYSSNEVQFIGAQCSNDNMHLFNQKCFIEFIDVDNHQTKQICVTALNYFDLPMIRYKLGDCGNWSEHKQCNCPLTGFPLFALNQYRLNDFIVSKDGTRIEPFIVTDSILFINNIFNLNISFYKVIQSDYNIFEYIFYDDIPRKHIASIKLYLQNYLKELLKYPIAVNIQNGAKNEFAVSKGKFRYFINQTNSLKFHHK